MTAIKIGKFEIAQQNGAAGTVTNGVKYVIAHTGRNIYQKKARGVCGTADAILDLSIAPKPPFMTLGTTTSTVAWDSKSANVTITTNSQKFKVSSTGKIIVLAPSESYEVTGLSGEFNNNLGVDSQHSIALNFTFTSNTTATNINIPILIEYWNGTTYSPAGTFAITQSSADAGIVITADPDPIPVFEPIEINSPTNLKKTIKITSNASYRIEKAGGGGVGWIRLSRDTGSAGVADLDITVDINPTAAPRRTGNIYFQNPVSGSTILQLLVEQKPGMPYSITISPAVITFTNTEINTIKNITVTSNFDWQIEEVIN